MASVLGCVVISMENYRSGADDGNDLDSIDFDFLVKNLQVIHLYASLGVCASHSWILRNLRFWSEVHFLVLFKGFLLSIFNIWILEVGFGGKEGCTDANIWFPREKTCCFEVGEDFFIWSGISSSSCLKKRMQWCPIFDHLLVWYCYFVIFLFSLMFHMLQVIVDGAYALHSTLRSLLDIRVAVVNSVPYWCHHLSSAN